MPRNIPPDLKAAIASGATTLCAVIKIMPVQPGFAAFGITTLDVDVTYDDGNGVMTYSAAIGTEPSSIKQAADLSVNGGETKQLMPVFDTPVAERDLASGAYDYCKFISYLIDYNNLEAGHMVIQTGTLGRNTITDSGLSWTAELRGITQALKQSITEKWSLSCRAVFGSQTSTPQSRFPCKFNAEPLWSHGTVVTVGVDNTQLFTTTGLVVPYGGAPGLVRWTTGDNTGRSDETESFVVSSGTVQTIGLTFGASYPIKVGDEFDFRDDCPKTPTACKARNNWPNYRGEPTIPVSDNGAIAIGRIGGVSNATTTTDED